MRTVAAAAIAVIIGAVAFQTVFGFVDGAWNGTFMDWLAGQFLDHHNLEVFGVTPEIVLDNGGVKYFFLQLGICVIVAIVAVGAVSWRMASRRAERRAAAHAAELLGRYMSHDLEAHEAFPEGYEELALVASDVKRAAADQARRLEDESARRSDLITYLAHDLKTPLTSVIGYLSLIDEVPDLPAEQRCRYVGITLDKALRLEALINEFFDITRYGLAHIELELAPVDLSFLLVQMADEFLPALSAHGNRLVVTVEGSERTPEEPGEPLVITADAARLARVLNNLIKNAIAYSAGGTSIDLRAPPLGRAGGHQRLGRGRDHPLPQAARHLRQVLPRRRVARERHGRHRARPGHRARDRGASRGHDLCRERGGANHVHGGAAGRRAGVTAALAAPPSRGCRRGPAERPGGGAATPSGGETSRGPRADAPRGRGDTSAPESVARPPRADAAGAPRRSSRSSGRALRPVSPARRAGYAEKDQRFAHWASTRSSSQVLPVRSALLGSRTTTSPSSVRPASTMKWPVEVKSPGSTLQMTGVALRKRLPHGVGARRQLLRAQPQLGGALAHERPRGHAVCGVAPALGEGGHARGVEVVLSRERHVHHREAGGPAAVLLDGPPRRSRCPPRPGRSGRGRGPRLGATRRGAWR